jgi:hypothetical protein
VVEYGVEWKTIGESKSWMSVEWVSGRKRKWCWV